MPDDEGGSEASDHREAPLNAAIRNARTYRDDDDDEDSNYYSAEEFEEVEEIEIDPEDVNALEAFLPPNAGARRTLADMIFEKLDAGNLPPSGVVRISTAQESKAPDPTVGLDPKVVAVYTKIGQLLKGYRSGPLPKPFKILPSLPSWARLLAITQPQQWSPQAMSAATRIFVSNLKPAQAKVFMEGVLLEAVRQNITDNQGKLNVHLYDALKKALYKPAAFFKGVLFPLCEGGCTLKEAAIVGSVLAKVSVPVLHSAAALHRLASMDYTGPNSLFIRVLLDKKYALPYQVLDELVFHFVRLANSYKGSKAEGDKLPVLWHQSLLVFCQRYSNDLTQDQKNALLDVVRVRIHAQITPEIRRELVQSVARGEPQPDDATAPDVEMKIS